MRTWACKYEARPEFQAVLCSFSAPDRVSKRLGMVERWGCGDTALEQRREEESKGEPELPSAAPVRARPEPRGRPLPPCGAMPAERSARCWVWDLRQQQQPGGYPPMEQKLHLDQIEN